MAGNMRLWTGLSLHVEGFVHIFGQLGLGLGGPASFRVDHLQKRLEQGTLLSVAAILLAVVYTFVGLTLALLPGRTATAIAP
jgi:hypothetical protein